MSEHELFDAATQAEMATLAKKAYTEQRAKDLNALVQTLPDVVLSTGAPLVYVAWVHSGQQLHGHVAKGDRTEAILAATALLRHDQFATDTVSITIETVLTSERFKYIVSSLTKDRYTMPVLPS